jgi:hypothetical protein
VREFALARRAKPALAGILIAATAALTCAGPVAASAAGRVAAGAAGRVATRTAGWRVIETISAKNTVLGDGVLAFRNGSVWLGGESSARTPVLYHLTGGRWYKITLPGPEFSFVDDLSASSPHNVWAAIANEPDVAQRTAHGWVLTPFSHGSRQVLVAAVVTFSPTDTWAFYSAINNATDAVTGYAAHFNGSFWQTTRLPSPVSANSGTGLVSGLSPDDIWALTYTGTRYATLHYNGHRWRVVNIPGHLAAAGQTVYLREILALSSTNVWATGLRASTTGNGPLLLLRWNGSGWHAIGGRLPAGQLTGPIASDGQSGLWLAAVSRVGRTEMLHYSPGHWHIYQGPHSPVRGAALDILYMTNVPGGDAVVGGAVIGPGLGVSDGSAVIKYGS